MSDVDARYLGLTANQLAKIATDLQAENAKLQDELEFANNQCERAILELLDQQEQLKAENATLGRGECHNTSYRLDESRFHCSECSFGCWVRSVADGRDHLPHYCPNCGAKVVDE